MVQADPRVGRSGTCVAHAISGLVLAVVVVAIDSQIHSLSLSIAQYALVLVFSVLGTVVFLSIGQALVGLIRSAAAVNAADRTVFFVLAFFGLLGANWCPRWRLGDDRTVDSARRSHDALCAGPGSGRVEHPRHRVPACLRWLHSDPCHAWHPLLPVGGPLTHRDHAP